MKNAIVWLAGLLAVACNSNSDSDVPPLEGGLSFIVMGDAPYSGADKEMLEKAIPLVRAGDFPFVIHVGDYKGGRATCTDDHDKYQRSLIEQLKPIPVFYTPGDNEWTDCDRGKDPETGVKYSDLDRLEKVRALFLSELPGAPESFQYTRQEGQPENASWKYQNVQFLMLNVAGTNNARDWVQGDPLERALAAVTTRDVNNLSWLSRGFEIATRDEAAAIVIGLHADMTDIKDKPEDVMCVTVADSDKHECDAFTDLRSALRDAANNFAKPILIIHGDTAPFTLNQDFAGEEAATLWRLNAAGDAGIGGTGLPYGTRDITVVTIDVTSDTPFEARGLVTGKSPK